MKLLETEGAPPARRWNAAVELAAVLPLLILLVIGSVLLGSTSRMVIAF